MFTDGLLFPLRSPMLVCWLEFSWPLLPPPSSPFGVVAPQTESRIRKEWPRSNQQTISAPRWALHPCLYACLIGQKQHAWLCLQDNKTYIRVGWGTWRTHSSSTFFVVLIQIGLICFCLPPCCLALCGPNHVYCQPSPERLLSPLIGPSSSFIVLWHGFGSLSKWLSGVDEPLTHNLGGSPDDGFLCRSF